MFMIRVFALMSVLLLSACASMDGTKNGEWTKDPKDGLVYFHPYPMEHPTNADGTLIPKEELDRIGWEPPPPRPPRQPVWSCTAQDYGSTALGLSTGLVAEINPLPFWAIGIGAYVGNTWARKQEENGDDRPAKWISRVHCWAARWNVAVLAYALFIM